MTVYNRGYDRSYRRYGRGGYYGGYGGGVSFWLSVLCFFCIDMVLQNYAHTFSFSFQLAVWWI